MYYSWGQRIWSYEVRSGRIFPTKLIFSAGRVVTPSPGYWPQLAPSWYTGTPMIWWLGPVMLWNWDNQLSSVSTDNTMRPPTWDNIIMTKLKFFSFFLQLIQAFKCFISKSKELRMDDCAAPLGKGEKKIFKKKSGIFQIQKNSRLFFKFFNMCFFCFLGVGVPSQA